MSGGELHELSLYGLIDANEYLWAMAIKRWTEGDTPGAKASRELVHLLSGFAAQAERVAGCLELAVTVLQGERFRAESQQGSNIPSLKVLVDELSAQRAINSEVLLGWESNQLPSEFIGQIRSISHKHRFAAEKRWRGPNAMSTGKYREGPRAILLSHPFEFAGTWFVSPSAAADAFIRLHGHLSNLVLPTNNLTTEDTRVLKAVDLISNLFASIAKNSADSSLRWAADMLPMFRLHMSRFSSHYVSDQIKHREAELTEFRQKWRIEQPSNAMNSDQPDPNTPLSEEPLSELELIVIGIITSVEKGKGIKGPKILDALSLHNNRSLDAGSLGRVLQSLKARRLIRNRRGVGYYASKR